MRMMHAKRLIKLINFLSTIKPKQFDFSCYASERTCGTVCCALGWAGMMPEFRRHGLVTNPTTNGVTFTVSVGDELKSYGGTRAAEQFFGLTKNEAYGLFIPCRQEEIGLKELQGTAKMKSVVLNMVEFIKRYYNLTVKDGKYEVVSRKGK